MIANGRSPSGRTMLALAGASTTEGVAQNGHVDAATPGPPGELGELGGRQELVGLPVELGQLLDGHRAGRHVDAQRQRLGGEDFEHGGFERAIVAHDLDRLRLGVHMGDHRENDAPGLLNRLIPMILVVIGIDIAGFFLRVDPRAGLHGNAARP